MKRIFLAFLVVFIQALNIYSQDRPSVSNRNFTIYGVIISLKGGASSGDKFLSKNSVNFSSAEVPPGGLADISAEYPLGKDFYGGLNLNGWFAKDKFTDNSIDVIRKSYGINFSAFAKYRYLIRKTSLNLGAGIGRSLIIMKYNYGKHDFNSDMTNINANIGVDHFFDGGFFISAEASYYYLFGGISPVGEDRNNQMFLGKIGIGLVFPLKRRL